METLDFPQDMTVEHEGERLGHFVIPAFSDDILNTGIGALDDRDLDRLDERTRLMARCIEHLPELIEALEWARAYIDSTAIPEDEADNFDVLLAAIGHVRGEAVRS